MSRGSVAGSGRRAGLLGAVPSGSASTSLGSVAAIVSSRSASVSSSCSSWSRSFSDERPNATRSALASRARSASISYRCSSNPARAAANSVRCAATMAACSAISTACADSIALRASTSLGRLSGSIGMRTESRTAPRRAKQNLHSACRFRPPRSHRRAPVDALGQHRQLRRCERDRAAALARRRPDEVPAF
jgi:hypothetical protein